jgi:hypothetical protein
MRRLIIVLSVILTTPILAAPRDPALTRLEGEFVGKTFTTKIPVGIGYVYSFQSQGSYSQFNGQWMRREVETRVSVYGDAYYVAIGRHYPVHSPGLELIDYEEAVIDSKEMVPPVACIWSGGRWSPFPCINRSSATPPGTEVTVDKWLWKKDGIRLELSVGYGSPSITFVFGKGFQNSASRESILSVISSAFLLEDFENLQRAQAEYTDLRRRLDVARSTYSSTSDSERLKAGEELLLQLRAMAKNRSIMERLAPGGSVNGGPATVQGKYVMKGESSNYLEFRPDGVFSMLYRGKVLVGNYTVKGERITYTASWIPKGQGGARFSGATIWDDDKSVWEKQTNPQEPVVSASAENTSAQYTKESADLEAALSQLRTELQASLRRQKEDAKVKRVEEIGAILKGKDRQIDSLMAEVQAQKASGLAGWRKHEASLAQVRRLLEEKAPLYDERAGLGQVQSNEESTRLAQQRRRLDSLRADLESQRQALGRLKIDEDYRAMDRKLTAQRDVYTRVFGTATFAAEANKYLVLLQQMYDNRLQADRNGSPTAAGEADALLKEIERTQLRIRRSP